MSGGTAESVSESAGREHHRPGAASAASDHREPRAAALLGGRRIVLTRPHDRSRSLAAMLREHGADVEITPAIEIVPPSSYAALDACLARLASYQWLLLTSVAAVDAVESRLALLFDTERRLPRTLRVAAVGATTARAFTRRFGELAFTGTSDAETLACNLPVSSGDRALFVCGDRARDLLPSLLAERGVQVDRAVAYCTVARDLDVLTAARDTPIDAIVLCSPSAAQAVADPFTRRRMPVPRAICLGATTAAAARALSIPVAAVAEVPGDIGIVDATLGVFASDT